MAIVKSSRDVYNSILAIYCIFYGVAGVIGVMRIIKSYTVRLRYPIK
jgi:hypothetical protein